MLKISKATMDDLDRINDLYTSCINDLNEKGIYQWDNKYPNINTYINSISGKCHYIFEVDYTLVGSVILNESQSEEWDTIQWNYKKGNILVIHALAINPISQGKGYGQKIIELCEDYGLIKGYKVMRLDVFSANQVAIRLYEKNGYEKVGAVYFDSKPKGHQKYYCYEKQLNK